MDKNKFSVIFLWVQTRETVSENYINEVFGGESVPVRTAKMWFQRFRQGDEKLDEVKHTGGKRSLDDDTLMEFVEAWKRSIPQTNHHMWWKVDTL